MVNVLCIVQARLTSSRLPDKVLMQLGDSRLSILEHINSRLSQSRRIDKTVFAIPDSPQNNKLAFFLEEKHFDFYRGSEDNVLERFYRCAIQYRPRIIVRATCDNPFVDWKQIDNLIDSLDDNDYVSSVGAPIGTSASAFYAKALYIAYERAESASEKEHVTPYIYTHLDQFAVKKVPYYINVDAEKYRLTVDTEEDFKLADALYRDLYKGFPINNTEVYSYLDSHPEIREINLSVKQKTI